MTKGDNVSVGPTTGSQKDEEFSSYLQFFMRLKSAEEL